ncbi:protein LSD1-like [Gossypium australe]|uniref:Protein LSD1-like n=1 Tax=Gossypium australe TaxID=47621 RepID=A0A5B6WC51_9ROSI|nr:protein LSD1-like [Gossypium australe]
MHSLWISFVTVVLSCDNRFGGLPIPHSIFLIFQTGNARAPFCVNRPNQIASAGTMPSTSTSQTVVVENPMSVDESGKLVNMVIIMVKVPWEPLH